MPARNSDYSRKNHPKKREINSEIGRFSMATIRKSHGHSVRHQLHRHGRQLLGEIFALANANIVLNITIKH